MLIGGSWGLSSASLKEHSGTRFLGSHAMLTMGNRNSKKEKEKEHIVSMMFNLAKQSGMIPDIGIDESLVKFSGLNSAAQLKSYSSDLLRDLEGKAPDYVTNLGSALTTFKHVPNAVGLGALVISVMLDLIIRSLAEEQHSDSTLNMVRRVFGEEKASGIRDSMDEYIKRLSMHVNDPLKALEETECLEKQLSDQLTRLRNSMLHEDQMSTRSMKHWTNGAAFHLQMLVHSARLKMAVNNSSCEMDLQGHVTSVSTVTDFYQKHLHELLEKYTSYKRSTISIIMIVVSRLLLPCSRLATIYLVWDRETELYAETSLSGSRRCQEVPSDVYFDYMLS
ncbi:uncharacterized protein LOC108441699 [Pygocentrus nattereri]|uniref:uncharacterized protein LOC108441699 n=1 Tax=Pygocentrus nattereri TaxID=42514 RepID=UPI00081476CF|nr:uncharacterized protein LOC108441699 [Pygocentrus nattereri]